MIWDVRDGLILISLKPTAKETRRARISARRRHRSRFSLGLVATRFQAQTSPLASSMNSRTRVGAVQRTSVQAAEAGRAAALASSSNAVEMSRMLMTPIRL